MSALEMTFLEQQDSLARELGDPNSTTDDQWPLVDRKFEINFGELQFAKDTKMLLRIKTGTVTDKKIAIPSGWIETYVLVVNNKTFTNNKEISLTEYEKFVNSGGDHYYYWTDESGNRLLNFINTNQDDQEYRLYYFGKPTVELTADGDTSIFPSEFRKASVLFAAFTLLKQIGMTELSATKFGEYQKLVAEGESYSKKLYRNIENATPEICDDEEPQIDRQGKYPQGHCH